MKHGVNFTSPEAVVSLGVGKNMVSSIRFWMRAFGLSKNDIPTEIAALILDDEGYDPYIEDDGTLWILHYLLVKNNISSIYNLTFLEFQRERKEFERSHLLTFIRRKCNVPEQKNVYNENTVKKDIGVLLHNYVLPSDIRTIDDFSAIFINLGLIRKIDSEKYVFGSITQDKMDPDILLFILMDYKGEDMTISVDSFQELSLLLCMPLSVLLESVKNIAEQYQQILSYTDNSGIKNLQFIGHTDKFDVLEKYYSKR